MQALYEGTDSHRRLFHTCTALRREILMLAGAHNIIEVDRRLYKVKIYVASDLKALRELTGVERFARCGPVELQVRWWACLQPFVLTGRHSVPVFGVM